MFEITYRTEVVKCPNEDCGSNIHLSVGKVPGGVNDKGGWILECKICNNKFPYPVKNPVDYSRVVEGAIVLDTWDDDVGNRYEIQKKWGLVDFPKDYRYDNLLMVESGEFEPVVFSDIEQNIYFCPSCDKHIEPYVNSVLSERFNEINNEIKVYLSGYLKGRYGDPDSIFILLPYRCDCGWKSELVFYKEFKEREIPVKNEKEFYLIDVRKCNLEKTIDGIYTREECLEVLSKLLIRWQVYYNKVFIAAPFIGFDYKNAEQGRIDLWNWILKHTLPTKTFLLTRKKTFGSFIEGAKNLNLGIDSLKKYGLLNPTLNNLTDSDAIFKTNFHAKFYAGYDQSNAEALVGSFNIHGGGYFENIHFKHYATSEFMHRYLNEMGIINNPSSYDENGELLILKENSEHKLQSEVAPYTGSRKNTLDKF